MGSAEPSRFGELLRRYRTAAGLTQEELAERAGLSARGIQDLERGLRRSPYPDTTRRLAEALGLGPAERAALLGAVDQAGLSGTSAAATRPAASSSLQSAPGASVRPLPTGTVTFLLTDIVGSARSWDEHPDAMPAALARHDELIEALVDRNQGAVVRPRGEGDSRFAVFVRASDALAAALAIQRALHAERWPDELTLRVRMAIHTGEADLRAGDYYGSAVNRCARLRGIAHGGQCLVSEATCELARATLPAPAGLRDLGWHRLPDLGEPEHAYQLTHPDLPADFPPLRSLDARTQHLPTQLASFVGRERELADVTRLLSSTRLLTLTGAGGIGKTRLALEAARRMQDDYSDGVRLVELAALADPRFVPQAVADVVAVREQSGHTLVDALLAGLRRRQLLLVLDNCEHVVQACAELADSLLRACPALRILATSLESLGIGGETVCRVPSLSLPVSLGSSNVVALTHSEAGQLFLQRAQAALPAFQVTERNAQLIGHLCRRLDGIALALELAAAWVPVLSVEEIVKRLDDALGFLVTGSRVAPPRQQTLRATLDWSYKLITEPERELLVRLSVFAGGWMLSDAEMVCAGPVIPRKAVLDLLGRLVNKSFVLTERAADGGVRYRLLEPVRQYAREHLMESNAADLAQQQHAQHFLELAEQGEVALLGPDQGIWLERLEREHDNLRAALAWAESSGNREVRDRLASTLARFWAIRGHLHEGLRWLDAADGVGSGASAARAKLLAGSGWLALLRGDVERAKTDLRASLALVRQLHDTLEIAESLKNLGRVALEEGDVAGARACFAESLMLSRARGYRWAVAFNLTGLAQVALRLGDPAKAVVLFRRALAAYRELDSPRHVAVTLSNLASALLAQGKVADARELYADALEVVAKVSDPFGLAHILAGIAGLVDESGQPQRAQHLLGAAAGLRTQAGYPLSASDHAWPDASLSTATGATAVELPSQDWEEGRTWPYDRALFEAIRAVHALN